MPIDIKQGLTVSLPLVASKEKHRDYDHVVELSEKKYRPLITGKKADHLIHRFNRREDVEAHSQRVLLTQLISPAVHNTLMAPARKIPRVRPTTRRADFGADAKDQNAELLAASRTFYGGKSVDHFFGSVLLDQGAIDPNAFCLLSFKKSEDITKPPVAFPSLVSCTDAWNFEYFNGELQWLFVHRDITFKKRQEKNRKPKPGETPTGKKDTTYVEVKGNWFCTYMQQYQIMYTQVDPSLVNASVEGVVIDAAGKLVKSLESVSYSTPEKYYYRVTTDELYEVVFYEQKAGKVPAFRLGYIPDHETNGRTMVNLWNAALPYFMKGIKAGSELDLTASLHAFLQKLQYANPCRGFTNEGGRKWDCINGFEPGGKKQCRQCGGSGWDVIKSAQDHMTFRMPRTKDEFLELANMVHYVPLPTEVLKWQDEYVDKLENKCYRATYNSDRFRQDAVSATATGEIIDLDAVYDTLQPVADWYSQSWVLVHYLLASFTIGSDSLEKLKVSHTFPRNLRFETVTESVTLMKGLKEAGARTSSLMAVNDRIEEDLYADDPVALKKQRVKSRFDPFNGLAPDQVIPMISQDNTSKLLKVFWFNQPYIYRLAEKEARGRPDVESFYDLAEDEQEAILEKLTTELMDAVVEEADAAAEKAMLGMNPDPNAPDPNAPDPPPDGGLPPSKANSPVK